MSHRAEFIVPDESSHTTYYPKLHASIDDDGDLWLMNEEGSLLLSLEQAYHLARNLGQALIEYQRSWGALDLHTEWKPE